MPSPVDCLKKLQDEFNQLNFKIEFAEISAEEKKKLQGESDVLLLAIERETKALPGCGHLTTTVIVPHIEGGYFAYRFKRLKSELPNFPSRLRALRITPQSKREK